MNRLISVPNGSTVYITPRSAKPPMTTAPKLWTRPHGSNKGRYAEAHHHTRIMRSMTDSELVWTCESPSLTAAEIARRDAVRVMNVANDEDTE